MHFLAIPGCHNCLYLIGVSPHSGGIIWPIGKSAVLKRNIQLIILNKLLHLSSKGNWVTGAAIDDTVDLILQDCTRDHIGQILNAGKIEFVFTSRKGE